MARNRQSRVGAFGLGLLAAVAVSAAAIGAYDYFAPPAPDRDSGVVPSIAGFAQSAGALAERWASNVTPRGRAAHELSSPETVAAVETRPEPTPVKPAPELVSANSDANGKLTRSIQQELVRVGCYAGAINGTWDDSTRDAMVAFNSNVRVQLKVTGPDYILLTLLQGHGTRACSKACEPGNASCEGRSVVAKRKPQPAPSAVQPKAVAAVPAKEPAPAAEARPSSSTPAATAREGAWRTTVAVAPPPPAKAPAPAAVPAQPPVVVAQPVPSAPALPGRMAMGGPAVEPPRHTPEPVAPVASPTAGLYADPAAAPGATALPPGVRKATPRERPVARPRPETRDVFARINLSAP